VKFRSRVAEIARLLSLNYQRFRMLPSTGLVRYERRPQLRPTYSVPISEVVARICEQIRSGALETNNRFILGNIVKRDVLSQALEAVLTSLSEVFLERNLEPNLAPFQELSLLTTLCGLYSPTFTSDYDGHIVTAGVGSGKSFAFQIGALIHIAYKALQGKRGIQVLLLYPRVVLAANQFQELEQLAERVESKLGISLGKPVLDAGGQLSELRTGPGGPVRGQLFQAIREAYQGERQLLISNLDTLANRLDHPESSEGLVRDLDLIVFDEVHLLSGLYGAHARMLLRRLELLRAMWQLRKSNSELLFEELIDRRGQVRRPYIIAASATIAEPKLHFARLVSSEPNRFFHIDVENPNESGWVHHTFLRQRPEASSMTAAVNAVACLVHNRPGGLYQEYYERSGGGDPLRLDEIQNPVQPSNLVSARAPKHIHKTLGFSDSLDGVNRWADLISDNESSKTASMGSSPNPALSAVPYFARFQEPLWRVIHHLSFGENPPAWHAQLYDHYGNLCRDCKRGIKRRIARIPEGLRQVQREAVDRLWDFSADNDNSYLGRLGVGNDYWGSATFASVTSAAKEDIVGNLDECGFFRAGLCWWWSRDHLGSNHPRPASGAQPVNGFKKPREHPEQKYIPLNAIRVRSFTSKDSFDVGSSINELFCGPANRVFRDISFADGARENTAFVIGSPRIEVGIDLSRVSEGITFRAMRDPASLQQKVGRVGREPQSDSLLVHIVTDNARDHFYLRNPRIALDPEYLQPIPLHENNQLVARNHYFMGILDFLALQGAGPRSARIADDGDRIALVNDHKYLSSFSGWDKKVKAVNEFLFGGHPRRAKNIANLEKYLASLGARGADMRSQQHPQLGPSEAPTSGPAGAIDVFQHEFGTNFFLTPLPFQQRTVTLAEICSSSYRAPLNVVPGLPRHSEFLRTLPQDDPLQKRSYLFQILTLPLFRRGIPLSNLPGNQPFLWTPNFFEAVGKEYVRVLEEANGRQRELGYETVGLTLALLSPGTVSYRYTAAPRKVPVSSLGGRGTTVEVPEIFGVKLDVGDPQYFEPAGCPDLGLDDLPVEFSGDGASVPVFRPRQVGLIPAQSEPLPTADGLLADDDERPYGNQSGIHSLATPPRCFPLRWYRLATSSSISPIKCRFVERFHAPAGQPSLDPLELPPILKMFHSIGYDRNLHVTEFTWGLDRQFMTRQIEAARLIYRDADPQTPRRIALGHHYTTSGIRYEIDLRPNSPIGSFLDDLQTHPSSAVFQGLLDHSLHAFLEENARNPQVQGAPWWVEPSRPSVFTVRNLKTLIWFHILEHWHPEPATNAGPTSPPFVALEDLVGCFTPGHANFISEARFKRLCQWVAAVQNPTSVNERVANLTQCYGNFQAACERVASFNIAFVRRTAEDLLLNSLGITIQAAGLRLTGAEEADLAYFYKRHSDGLSQIFLFDTDELGNGTSDLVARMHYVSPIERILVAKERALGGTPDPLPTTDFADCFEETLQECPSSHAAQFAFHDFQANGAALQDLESARIGERLVAGTVFDFLRSNLGLSSFDGILPFRACPEFVAYVSQYPRYGATLVPSALYPTFQALESSMGFCFDGCISCVVAPEQNIRGILSAKDTVSKLLMDALYRVVVCESADPVAVLTYPGNGPGRTEPFGNLALRVAEAMGKSISTVKPFQVELPTGGPPTVITILRATGIGSWSRVFRPNWDPAPPPTDRVRPRTPL
jgi:hypothetical protein